MNIIINTLIPTPHNNYKPWILHSRGLSFLLVMVISLNIIIRSTYSRPQVLGENVSLSKEEILNLTNVERQKLNISDLKIDENLNLAAQKKLNDMIQKNYWAHYSPSETAPWIFILESDYSYLFAGENLAKDFYSSQSVVQAWMDSDGHRNNLLNPKFEDMGIAYGNVMLDDQESIVIVQFLAKKAPSGSVPLNIGTSSEVYSVLGGVVNRENPANKTISNFISSKMITLVTIILLSIILTIDAVVLSKVYKVKRISGKYWSHLIFLYTLGVISYLITW